MSSSNTILPENLPTMSTHADRLDSVMLQVGDTIVNPLVNVGIVNTLVDDEFGAGVCRLEYYPLSAFLPAHTGFVRPYDWSQFSPTQEAACRRIYEAYDRSYLVGREDQTKKATTQFVAKFLQDASSQDTLLTSQEQNWYYMVSNGILVLRECATENVLTMSQVQALMKLNTNTTPPIERGRGWNTRLLRVLGRISERFNVPLFCPVERLSQRHKDAGWSPHHDFLDANPDIITMPEHVKEWFGRECIPLLSVDRKAMMAVPSYTLRMNWRGVLWGLVVANTHWGRYKERLPPVVMTPDEDSDDDKPTGIIMKSKPKNQKRRR